METKQIRIRTIDEMVKSALASEFNVYSEACHRKMLLKEKWDKLEGKIFTAEKNVRGRWVVPGLPGIYGRVETDNLARTILWDVI